MFLWFNGYNMAVDSFDPTSITVNDPASGSLYQAVDAWAVSGLIVEVEMEAIGPSSGEQTLLNVGAASGIVDADTSVPWEGCTDLVLPFP